MFSQGSVADAVSHVLTLSGLEARLKKEREDGGEDRLANVEELVTAAKRYEEDAEAPTLEDFLQRIALTSDQDAIDESAGVVLLMTLHAAKGLEFPIVFIVGLEEGMLPHERSLQDGDVEEERRLLFVGITRAMKRLYISHARQRLLRGALLPRASSRFLLELPDEAVITQTFAEESPSPSEFGRRFVPSDEHLSPDEWRSPRRKRNTVRKSEFDDEPVFSPDDPTGRALRGRVRFTVRQLERRHARAARSLRRRHRAVGASRRRADAGFDPLCRRGAENVHSRVCASSAFDAEMTGQETGFTGLHPAVGRPVPPVCFIAG